MVITIIGLPAICGVGVATIHGQHPAIRLQVNVLHMTIPLPLDHAVGKGLSRRAWAGEILTVRRRAPVDLFSTHVGIEHTRRDIADRSVEVIPRRAIDPRRSAQRYVAIPGTQKSFVIVRIVHKCSSKLAEVIAAQRHASRLAGVPQGRRTETECGGPD